jgi:hypothetical protein
MATGQDSRPSRESSLGELTVKVDRTIEILSNLAYLAEINAEDSFAVRRFMALASREITEFRGFWRTFINDRVGR